MKKIFSKIAMVVLGLVCLGGCFMENKNTRAYMERHFGYLAEVYPTQNVDEIFEKFPEGAKILHSRSYGTEESPSVVSYNYIFNIDIYKKIIYGTETKIVYTGDKTEKEYVENIEYRNGKIYYLSQKFQEKEFKFLFETINYNEIIKKELHLVHYAMARPLYSVSYWVSKDYFKEIVGGFSYDKFYIDFADYGHQQADIRISEYGSRGNSFSERIERIDK